jgi:hypothetical protein
METTTDRKEKVARAAQNLIDAVRALKRLEKNQRTLAEKAARDRFKQAIGDFAEAIGS